MKASSLSDDKKAAKSKTSVSIGTTPSKYLIGATRPLMGDDDKFKLPVGRVDFDILGEHEGISLLSVLICLTFN